MAYCEILGSSFPGCLVNIRKHYNFILKKNYTFIGTQYLPYAEEWTRIRERNWPGG